MNVQHVMTHSVNSCPPTTTLAAAARMMAGGDFGFLPVVDMRGQLVGVVTDRDVCLAIARAINDPMRVGVRDVMQLRVHACREADTVADALATMKTARVRRLPVLDEQGHLTGIVSIDDLIRHAVGRTGGVSCEALVDAFRAICEHRMVIAAGATPRSAARVQMAREPVDECC